MKPLAFLIGLAATAATFGQADPPDLSLTLAGKSVQVKLPQGPEAPAAGEVIAWQGWNYRVGKRGEVFGRYKGNGSWDEVRQLWGAAKEKVKSGVPWKVKVYVLTRTVDAPSGPLRGRYNLDSAGQAEALRQIGLFKILAESYTGGAYRIELNVEVVNDAVSTLPKEFIAANLNSGDFQAEDKVDRGPFDSGFVLSAHPRAAGSMTLGTNGVGTRIDSISLFPAESTVLDSPASHAMFDHWWQSMRRAFLQAKVALPLPDFEALAEKPARPIDAVDRSAVLGRWPKPRAAGPWTGADPDPTVSAHVLSDAPTAHRGLIGRTADAGPGLLVPAEFAPFVASQLANPILEGRRQTAEGILLQFRLDAESFVWKDAPQAVGAAAAADAGWNVLGATTANVKASVKDGVLSYSETGSVRYGKVELFGGRKVDLSSVKSVKFKVKSESGASLSLFAENHGKHVLLGGVTADPLASQLTMPKPAEFQANGKWQDISIPVTAGGAGKVFLGASGERKRSLGPVVFEVSDLILSGDPVSEPTPSQNADPRGSEVEKVLFLSQAAPPVDTVISLLGDGSSPVVARALQVLQAVKAPKAVPTLIKLSSSLDPDIAEPAIRALDFQGTLEAKVELRRLVTEGPLDLNRQIAAERMAADGNADDAGLISQLFGAKGWVAKVAAVDAIAKLKGPNTQVILLAFLLDDEPLVRLDVLRPADLNQRHVQRRVLWASVNDASDAVRLAAIRRLLDSPDAKLRQEGARGIRDESRYVRLETILALPSMETSRNALRIAVVDSDPEVRAAALAKFAALPDAVSADEVSIALDDPFPLVQIQAIALIKAKSLPVTEAQRARFKSSVSADVVKLAKDLWP